LYFRCKFVETKQNLTYIKSTFRYFMPLILIFLALHSSCQINSLKYIIQIDTFMRSNSFQLLAKILLSVKKLMNVCFYLFQIFERVSRWTVSALSSAQMSAASTLHLLQLAFPEPTEEKTYQVKGCNFSDLKDVKDV